MIFNKSGVDFFYRQQNYEAVEALMDRLVNSDLQRNQALHVFNLAHHVAKQLQLAHPHSARSWYLRAFQVISERKGSFLYVLSVHSE